VLAVVILVVVAMLPFLIPYPKVTFLNALLTGDEHIAQQYLSPELQSAVEAQCPNGQITACATNLISPAWGNFETVTFIFGSASPSAELFYASYSERWEPIAIVLVHDPEDKNIITGWRGGQVSFFL
jgi:hypothetical protein